jgi:hypothetical protein
MPAWAVGSKTGFGAQESTFILHWDGTAWREVQSPNPSNTGDARSELRSVVANSKGDAWALRRAFLSGPVRQTLGEGLGQIPLA